MKRGDHPNILMQRMYNKYGAPEIAVILICRVSDILFYEQLCLDSYQPPLNVSKIAGKIEFTDEIRAKIAISMRGNTNGKGPRAPEVGRKVSAAKKGVLFSEAHKQALKEAWKTRPPASIETNKKISLSVSAYHAQKKLLKNG